MAKLETKIYVNVTDYETRIAVFEAGQLVELLTERPENERIVGDMLGHKCKASTRRYAKMRTESLKQIWEQSPGTVPKLSPEGKVIDLTEQKKRRK